ncbi:hypothetical protein DXG01_004284 [Tephrocybe rancida]|nr:hypothetical protein DXG01_004284 [Tephrocybe rancida]
MSMTVYTEEAVAKTISSQWLIVDGFVYDLTKFISLHPGGRSVLLDEEVAGRDATKIFYSLHRTEVLQKPQYTRLKIGHVERDEEHTPTGLTPSGSLSEVPYAEPTWLTARYHSPYYKDHLPPTAFIEVQHHRRFQTAMRKFVEEVVFPDAQAREIDGKPPSKHVFAEMARLNLIAMRLGPGKHLKGRVLMGGLVKPEEFDSFHELIIAQELGRIHARGYSDGLGGGTCIGLPPVLNFAKPALRNRIAAEVLGGQKFICLAVTEAFAGSDVAALRCRARRVNDYFTVACRTESGGITVLVIPRGDGVETRPITTSYSITAGTAYVTFDDVRVPFEYTLGIEEKGLQVILSNFNHERWGMTCGAVSAQRTILEECLKWSMQREVFGKPLMSQAVVRSKLAAIISRIESSQNWLEAITYQMTHMNYQQQATHLAGQIAFLKMYTTRGAQDTARDAVQVRYIFGGRGITRSGMGKFIEHVRNTLILHGRSALTLTSQVSSNAAYRRGRRRSDPSSAEDVMGDLGVRQALRTMPKHTHFFETPPTMTTLKEFTTDEVAQHAKSGDLWIIVDSKVYDLSKFASMHPGGLSVLLENDVAGQDVTETFFSLHRYEVLQRPQYARLQIGTISGQTQTILPRAPGALSKVPYAEPTWLTQGYHSPYYKDHHRAFQTTLRTFVDETLFPDAQALQEKGKMPSKKVFEAFARLNIHAMRLGPGEHLKGRTLMNGAVAPEEFDFFHELIMGQEMSRIHARGYHDGAAGGTMIGLPAIKNFARPELREKILTEVLDGKKLVCLAISEAFAGSDVAGTRTFAKKSADGTYYTVTVCIAQVVELMEIKKWITNGHFADYFVTGCRTEKGMIVLLIERGEGVETKHINTSYGPASGTAFVTFDQVKVPVENTLGPDNGGGLIVILSNFNHERWTTQRKVFGKPLNSQAVIRSKLASMIARVESAQAWLESVTYQMCNMDYKQQSALLAGSVDAGGAQSKFNLHSLISQIAFLKKHCTETAQLTAKDAVQVGRFIPFHTSVDFVVFKIFGGRGITKTDPLTQLNVGMGRFIEHDPRRK